MGKRILPAPPASLSSAAQARWKAVIGLLPKDVDLGVLETYCQVYVRWREAEAAIAKSSVLVRDAKGGVKRSPLLDVAKEAAQQVVSIEKRLGIGMTSADSVRRQGSRRQYAKHRGITEAAVRKALSTGRLRECLITNAKREQVIDFEIADREWQENAVGSNPSGGDSAVVLLNDVQRRVAMERERKLKIDNDLRSGRLVDAKAVAKEAFESARIIREGLLNIPARVAAELAAESDPGKVHMRLDAAIREALNATADALLAAGNE
jgi:P27 family predicted phage terminase small subunit